jgi:hypothetical protein
MHGAHDQQKRRHHHDQHHVVHGQVILQINQAKQLAAWHALQAVFTTGEGRLQADEEQHLRQRQRDHRGVDALAANGKETTTRPSNAPLAVPSSRPISGVKPHTFMDWPAT